MCSILKARREGKGKKGKGGAAKGKRGDKGGGKRRGKRFGKTAATAVPTAEGTAAVSDLTAATESVATTETFCAVPAAEAVL